MSSPALRSSECLIGIIDNGCDFHHPDLNFLHKPDVTSRIIGFFDMNNPSLGWRDASEVSDSKRKFNRKQIQGTNIEECEYKSLSYKISSDDTKTNPVNGVVHGTGVLDIATKNTNYAVLFVEPPKDAKSKHILEAVNNIFKKANGPCVINISMVTNYGPGDGTGETELGIDRLVAEKGKKRAVIIAIGNDRGKRCRYFGQIQNGKAVIKWKIFNLEDNGNGQPMNHEDNIVYIWHKSSEVQHFELFRESTKMLEAIKHGDSGEISIVDPNQESIVVGRFQHRINNGEGYEGMSVLAISLRSHELSNSAVWAIKIVGTDSSKFDASIGRTSRYQSSFELEDQTNNLTESLNALATGRETIAVGAYDLSYSCKGQTTDGRYKPDFFERGYDVECASTFGTLPRRKGSSGSSFATPRITQLVANILQNSNEQSLTTVKIKQNVECFCSKKLSNFVKHFWGDMCYCKGCVNEEWIRN